MANDSAIVHRGAWPSAGEPPLPQLSEYNPNVADAAEEMEVRQSDSEVQDDQEDEGAVNLIVWPCGCDEVSEPHLENFATFQRHVRDGLRNMKSQDVRYDHIEVLIVYWENSDVNDMGENARGLGSVFGTAPYGFNVTTHVLNNRDHSQRQIDDAFKATLNTVEARIHADDDTSNLLILYYGGHGTVEGADRLWKPKKKNSAKHLIWSKYQNRMYDIECDILYLFDCCYSLAMVETTTKISSYRRRCEVFCSSGLKDQSGAQTKTNFTAALKTLLERKRTIAGLTFKSLCETMTGINIRETLIAEPRWMVSPTANPSFRGKITMTKKSTEAPTPQTQQDESDSGYESQIESQSRISDARILIKIRLTNPAEELLVNNWLKWFEQRPHNVAHIDLAIVNKIEWVGVFESDSSLALITIPIWLWNTMEHDPACESLGIVRSPNLLKEPAVRKETATNTKLEAQHHEFDKAEQAQVSENIKEPATPNVIRVPIVRNPRYKHDGLKSYVQILQKYGISPTLPGPFFRQQKQLMKRSSDGTTGKATLADQQHDSPYTCPVQIGTPPQTLNLGLDSGSSGFWVLSTKLPPKVQSEGSAHKIFDPSLSSTFINMGSTYGVEYSDQFYVKGTVGTDTFQIGNITIQMQALELAHEVSTSFIQDASSDGVLGLAFGTLDTVQPLPVATPIENMIRQYDIPQNNELFTVYLSSIKDQNESSFYTFGAIDTLAVKSGASQIAYTPVRITGNRHSFWRFDSSSAKVNDQTIYLPGNTAVADTATPLLLTSDEVCQKIYNAIPGAMYDQRQQGYVFPASADPDTLPTVTFMVGDTPITVAKPLLAWAPVGGGSTVYGAIQSRGDLDFNVYGGTFLQNVYAVFDCGNLRFGCIQRLYNPFENASKRSNKRSF